MSRACRRCGGEPGESGHSGGSSRHPAPSAALLSRPSPALPRGVADARGREAAQPRSWLLVATLLLLCGVADAQVKLIQYNPTGAHSTKELMPASYCAPGITCGTLRWGPGMTTNSNNVDVLPFGPWPISLTENANTYVNFTVRACRCGRSARRGCVPARVAQPPTTLPESRHHLADLRQLDDQDLRLRHLLRPLHVQPR